MGQSENSRHKSSLSTACMRESHDSTMPHSVAPKARSYSGERFVSFAVCCSGVGPEFLDIRIGTLDRSAISTAMQHGRRRNRESGAVVCDRPQKIEVSQHAWPVPANFPADRHGGRGCGANRSIRHRESLRCVMTKIRNRFTGSLSIGSSSVELFPANFPFSNLPLNLR